MRLEHLDDWIVTRIGPVEIQAAISGSRPQPVPFPKGPLAGSITAEVVLDEQIIIEVDYRIAFLQLFHETRVVRRVFSF
jgi:hypothetical protein